MWFIFGFITFISITSYLAYKRINASWKGTEGEVNGIRYEYDIQKNKSQTVSFKIGIECPPYYDFVLKRERWYDRFFKDIGLSVEHQVGRDDFDDFIYIVSDDEQLKRRLTVNRDLIERLLDLFETKEIFHSRTLTVTCNSNRLWVNYKPIGDFNDSHVESLALEVVPVLKQIVDALKGVELTKTSRWRDPFVIKAAVILGISSGLAINGVIHLYRLHWVDWPVTLDLDPLFYDALFLGLILIALLIMASIMLLGKTARAHLVLIELIFVGSFGTVASSCVELRDMNIDLDTAVYEEFSLKVYSKHIDRGRKRKTKYYITLPDWRAGTGRRELRVSRDMYNAIRINSTIKLQQMPGYLGYRWVKMVMPAN